VVIKLAELGYDGVGVDLDESMLAMARRDAPDLIWLTADLATLDLHDREPFELIVMAGNVSPLLAPDTVRACDEAGLTLVDRYSTWDAKPFSPDAGYAVSLHRLG